MFLGIAVQKTCTDNDVRKAYRKVSVSAFFKVAILTEFTARTGAASGQEVRSTLHDLSLILTFSPAAHPVQMKPSKVRTSCLFR